MVGSSCHIQENQNETDEHCFEDEQNDLSPAARAAMMAIEESEGDNIRDKKGHRSKSKKRTTQKGF